MEPGERSKFRAPYSNMSCFGSKFTFSKKVLVTFLGLFVAPIVIWCPGNCVPLALSLRPWLRYPAYYDVFFVPIAVCRVVLHGVFFELLPKTG